VEYVFSPVIIDFNVGCNLHMIYSKLMSFHLPFAWNVEAGVISFARISNGSMDYGECPVLIVVLRNTQAMIANDPPYISV